MPFRRAGQGITYHPNCNLNPKEKENHIMGAIGPTLSATASTVGGLAGTALGLANTASRVTDLFGREEARDDLALEQLRAQQALTQQQAAQDAALRRTEIQTRAAQDEAERREALRRAVARQRARFGASGLDASASGGSAEAVLLGLVRESEEGAASDAALDALRLAALDQNLSQRASLNLLQATQLAEKQDIGRLF
jgi:hypothetical protein